MLERRSWILLGLLAAAHLGLALWFASFTPYHTAGHIGPSPASDIGAPDEFAHANYVAQLMEGKGVPSLDLSRMKSDSAYRSDHYEDHQPPVFYFLDANWGRLLGASSEQVLGHSDTANAKTGGLILRSLNALIGAGTVLAAFFAAYWGFGRLDLAYGAAGIVAFLPMNVALSGALSNDPLLFFELAWVLALATRGVKLGWRKFDVPALGVLAGLAILTKTTGLVALPVILVALLIPQAKRASLATVGIGIALCALLCVPWFARNQQIYGDALGLKVFNEAFSDTAKKEDIEGIISAQGGSPSSYWTEWVGWTASRSFIGAFGYMDIWLNETGTAKSGPGAPNALYRLSLATLALLFLGWILSLRTEWAKESWPVTVLNAAMILTVLFLFVRFNSVYYQAQARYLFPALVPIAIGFAAGAVALGDLAAKSFAKGEEKPKPLGARVVGIVVVFLLALSIYAGTRLPGEFEKRIFGMGIRRALPGGTSGVAVTLRTATRYDQDRQGVLS